MTPLFWIEVPGDVPLPCVDTNTDGSPREADNVRYFDLPSAAKLSRLSEETLERAFRRYVQEHTDAPTEPLNEAPSEPGSLTFVPLDQENPLPSNTTQGQDDLLKGDAAQIRENVRRRMAGIAPGHYESFREQMEQLGYDILRRECYPVVQWNPDTKQQEVFCCATLDVVERKMLASGLCNGWEGPTLYAGEDGELTPMWTKDEPPAQCQVTLWRKGVDQPCIVLLDWNEAAQYTDDASGKKKSRNLTSFWRERPKQALEKCAKMKAMRTLFRDFVGAVYTREELPALSERHQGSLSQRHHGQLPERSTTLAGIRNRPLPNLQRDEEMESAVSTEAIGNEVDARIVMRARGLVQEFMINRVIDQARKEQGLLEDEQPEAFWGYVLDLASRRFGMRR